MYQPRRVARLLGSGADREMHCVKWESERLDAFAAPILSVVLSGTVNWTIFDRRKIPAVGDGVALMADPRPARHRPRVAPPHEVRAAGPPIGAACRAAPRFPLDDSRHVALTSLGPRRVLSTLRSMHDKFLSTGLASAPGCL